ncbi:amino acid ABC transporter permease [Metapseudomonas resinovorans]|uniref:amino acid ABC transporter permease n=1 Tax=Metapseudomonas resinovorans TaxID=53412 RepID=UPI0003FEF92E|nr:amino acid ABC transporter permease [Pseudomonas resinovorans]
MSQLQAQRLAAERKKAESEFDITQYEHVPRRYYGRMFFATLIVVLLIGLGNAFAKGQIEWSYVGQFLTSEAILFGLLNTIVMSVLAMILGVIFGVVTAVMRMSHNPILQYVALAYTWLFRGTPLILQLLLWFNLALIFPVISIPGLFQIETVTVMTPFVAALLGLSINQGAYTAEVVRAGLLSVDTGQYEAAKSIGMPRLQSLKRIILPQAMRIIIPPVGNEFIGMVKMTSLASVIQYSELLHNAQNIYYANARVMELLIVAGIWYLAVVTVLSFGQSRLERYFAKGAGKRS